MAVVVVVMVVIVWSSILDGDKDLRLKVRLRQK